MLNCKEKKLHNCSSSCYTSRYCNKKYFKLLVCGGFNLKLKISKNVSCIDVYKVGDVGDDYPPMKKGREHKTLHINNFKF